MDPSNNSTLDKYIFIGDNDQSGEFRAGYWLSDQPSAGQTIGQGMSDYFFFFTVLGELEFLSNFYQRYLDIGQ